MIKNHIHIYFFDNFYRDVIFSDYDIDLYSMDEHEINHVITEFLYDDLDLVMIEKNF